MKLKLVLLGLLVLGIMCFPVLASSINVVPAGGDVFLGEQGLNVAAGMNNSSVANWFAPGNDITKSAPGATRTISPTNFYVSPSDFGQYLGNWYVAGTQNVAFVVRDPSLTVSIRDNSGNDLTGQFVTQGTKLNFRIESNAYTASTRDPSINYGLIKVQTPDGTIYTTLAPSLNIGSIPLNSSLVTIGPWDTGASQGGSKLYKAGTYTVWAELSNALNTVHDNYNVAGKTSSSHVQLSISTGNLKLTSSTSSVTLGNQFSVTVNGIANTAYQLYVKSVGNDNAPAIIPSQQGITSLVNYYTADINTDSTGNRVIGFITNQSTKDKTWTIHVQDMANVKSDEIQVTVAKGGVTITSYAGQSGYFLGNEIQLAGTNTQSDTVYLFITGPNLPSAGGQLNSPRQSVTQGTTDGTWVAVDVNSDNTWSYKWQTSNISIDAGTYTIYAVAAPDNRDNLGSTQYGTTSLTLQKPGITATSNTVVAAGDKIHIQGNAYSQNSAGIAIWVLGKNFVKYYTTSVNSDGTYSYDISSGDTQNLAAGQYAIFVQSPMYNNIFDVYPSNDLTQVLGNYPNTGNVLFTIGQTADSAAALKQALDNPGIDDMYTMIQFTVGQPTINIPPITQHMIGDKFTISGTTNLALGDNILINIISSSFQPTDKTQSGAFSGIGGNTTVVAGTSGGLNTWTYMVDTTNFKADEYLFQASSVETSASSSTSFNVVPYVAPTPPPTPVPTPVVTAATPIPTPIPTTIPTTVPTTVKPTASPGFGSVVAIVGLIGVAFLVTRKL